LTLTTQQLRIALLVSLLLGVALRAAVVPTPGFPTDVGTFQAWAERMRQLGPGSFYAPGYFSDYPPGFLYVLWAVAAMLGGLPVIVAKALSIPFDLGIAVALYLLMRRIAGERAGLVAASIYFLNPALIYAGPYWGQVDAAGTLPMLLAVLAAAWGRFALAGGLGALAAMVKPQFGLGLFVVMVFAATLLVRERRPAPLLRAGAAAAVTVAALAIPFGLGFGELWSLVTSAAETYPYSSLYAFNVWAILADFWKPDDGALLGATYLAWGIALFGLGLAAAVVLLWRDLRRQTGQGSPHRTVATLLVFGALCVFAFYFLPTRVHERYLFPAFALLAPFAAAHRRALAAYLALSVFFLLSLLYAFTRYPQTGVLAPDFLEATLYQRPGVIALALFGMASAAGLGWLWLRGRARDLSADVVAPAVAATWPAEVPRLPETLRPGAGVTRRDISAALLLALLVLLTRGYRLDWPRDMYFDEVYHARTAMELLAGREPFEWTHPHLAKEIMAASIALLGNVRAVDAEDLVTEAVAYALDGDSFASGWPDGAVRVAERPRALAFFEPPHGGPIFGVWRFDAPVRALALDGGRVVAASDRQLVDIPLRSGPGEGAATRVVELASPLRALSVAGGAVVYATAEELVVYGSPAVSVPVSDTVAIWMKHDATSAYVAAEDGTVRLVGLERGDIQKEWRAGARVATMTVEPDSQRLILGDASEPILHSVDLESGSVEHVRLENSRTAPFRGPPIALATAPRARMIWVLGQDGVAVVEPHGVSAFAVVREAAGTRSLAVDDERDRVIAAVGAPRVEIPSGRLAFAWRFPGVLAAGVLAFFLYLLARRLFASRLIANALGALVLVDAAMFAQARIAMNDIYVGAAIVAGWYFVASALRANPRRSAVYLAAAGTALGLGLAAKWAAGPALLAVGAVSVFVTARAFVAGRSGTGGALDLLARRGLNAAYLATCFVVLPVAIYLLSYIPWFGLGHGFTVSEAGGWTFFELQRQMFTYHSQLTAPHPAGSPWWAWPLNLKPVYWEYAQASPTTSTYIYDAGNLVTWWAAIPAMGFLLYQALRARAWHLGLVVFAFAAQYVQWIPVTRVLFQYHFFTALPFYLLGLAAALGSLWDSPSRRRWALGLIAAGALWFVWFYPWLSALPVPGELAALYFWLPTWQYGCQFYPTFRCS
jgi:Gpi18-like mannosyltransferase/predicted membrane-bound dolichyl-phosphate-mannose-protein mannosyltransferase